ncbi:hypothetical protein [Desulfobulbus alkaliphilus]|uniref:hypothetical protein n=1 Tax=Desulfobulbus alkaliphilus TaxID=869814 RepID=UPI00196257C8|nr:hypothetical protein [Desulfobulbus alkaliphilus]MBM9536841.1 hypothetical protein [Desulfobulbus alkaliphilus]
MTNSHLPLFVQALLWPDCYAHPAADIRLVQTHISYVILAGEYVYKFKKPVNLGFLDFTTLEKRRSYCQQELILNRRLCPDIYLSLVEVTMSPEGGWALDGAGEVMEYGVKMVRMPEERMMPQLIASGTLQKEHIEALVEVLADFYQRAESGEAISRFGTAAAVGVNVLENFTQIEPFIGQGGLSRDLFNMLSEYARRFLAREELFAQRIQGGFIRDCHGDLYSANICLAEKVYIYDCIEFNERFRYCDVASDVAFLAMDLDFHGLETLSRRFIEAFIKRTGDTGLTEMIDFYKVYRAVVRAKIGLLTANDPAVAELVRADCLVKAAQYFQLAARYTAT